MKNLRNLFRRSGLLASDQRHRRAGQDRRSHAAPRRLNNEMLEKRELLAGDLAAPDHNYWNRFDVNDDRQITSRDALAIINYMGRGGEAEQVDAAGLKMFYDVNADRNVSAVDALGVINAISRGEEVGELVEFLITARDLNDQPIPADGSGEINVDVGEMFDIEISYDDLRTFNNRLGVFQLFVDIAASQPNVLKPVLNETQRLIIDETIMSVSSTGLNFSIPQAPPGVSGAALTYFSPINDFGNNPTGEIEKALNAFGYTDSEFEISTLDFGNNDLGYQIHWVGDKFGNLNLPNVSVDVVESNPADMIDTRTLEFAPFLADGVTPNTEAVRFNVNTFSRTFNDNEQFYSAQNRGEFSNASGFSGLGGLGMVPLQGGGIPQLTDDGSFIEPFDAFSFRVFISQPVTDLVISVNPGEDPESTLLYGRDDPVPPDMVLIQTTDTNSNGIARFTVNATQVGPEPTVSVAVNPASVNEDGSGALTYTFTRAGDTTEALTVGYTVSGTATAGTDFPAQSGTVTIPAGQTTATVMINPTDDTVDEPDETIILTVTDGSNYNVGTPSSATGTILDDDVVVPDPTVSVAVSPTSVNEDGAAALTYTFTRSGDATQALSVTYTVGGTATPGTDFPVQTGTVLIGAGQTTATVTINPTDDTVDEQDETIILTVTDGSNYNVGTPSSATGTIIDDDGVIADPTVSVMVNPTSVNEDGAGTLVYTFTRAGDATQALTVTYTVGGTATPGTDFPVQTGTVLIGAGQTTATVSINPTDDTVDEQDETIILTVTDGSNYNVGTPSSATGTILDDDVVVVDPTVSVTVNPTSVNEDGAGALVYTFARAGDTTQALSVTYTVGGTATQGTDFPAQSGTVTIGAGQTTATVSINPTDDTVVEPNETIILTVTDGSNYNVGAPSSATGTILNDDVVVPDPTVSVSVDPTIVDEDGTAALTYTFTRSGDATQALSVTYTVGGTATPGTDFPVQSGTVTIGAGQTTATVTINPTDDTVDEPNETIILTVTDGSNYNVGTPSSATGTIRDDDPSGPGNASISGAIFIDEINNVNAVVFEGAEPIRDGVRGSNESGLGSVEVRLVAAGVTMTTFTDLDGNYRFEGLAIGTYTVSFAADPSTMILAGPTQLTVPVTSDSQVIVNRNFLLFGTQGSALETVDLLASSYLRTNGSMFVVSQGGREGGRAALHGNGEQKFFIAGEGFEGVKFAEVSLNDERDAALLTIIEDDGDVLSALLSEDQFVVSHDGMGVQFFGGMDDFDFVEASAVAGEGFDDYRKTIDRILASM
jgi:thiamine phosphate synthase YjbQ (UPF0047 family)